MRLGVRRYELSSAAAYLSANAQRGGGLGRKVRWVGEANQSDGAQSAAAISASAARRRISKRNTFLIAALALVAGGICTLLLLSHSGDDPNAVKPKSDVDMAGWRAQVAAMPGALANPDMDTLYDVTVKECNDTQDQMTLELTLAGADPNLIRTNMKYVCPGKAHMVDDGLLKIQQNNSEFGQACRTPPSMRTENQAQLIEGMGPGACQSG